MTNIYIYNLNKEKNEFWRSSIFRKHGFLLNWDVQGVYLFILYLMLAILQLKISVPKNTLKKNSYILDIC